VDDVGDAPDAVLDGTCDIAVGPPIDCTLRAAIEEANNTPAIDTIEFSIPGMAPHTITLTSALPDITAPVVIDGTTEPTFAGVPIIAINAAGGGGARALDLDPGSDGSTIRSLVIRSSPGIAIRVFSPNNVIAGNYLGTNLAGTAAQANDVGVLVQSSGNRIGGVVAADRNVISGNQIDGVQLNSAGATANLVQGNYIGLNAAGTGAVPNANQGVAILTTASGNTVGGTVVAARNVISGNGGDGVRIASGATNNVVAGNFIGTNAAGTAGVPNSKGVYIATGVVSNEIGGTAAGAGNRIAFNTGIGVALDVGAGAGTRINRNEIYSNGALGIDLSENGVTANDAADADTGANEGKNFPVLASALTDGAGSATFAGSYHSLAAVRNYRIEFFASAAADPTGHGEGVRYLGFTTVTTSGAGNGVIAVTLATVLTAGEFVTATATDLTALETSEFSAAVQAIGTLVVTTTADTVNGNTASVAALIANPGADGRISLREAILATNATAGADTIRFGIPLSDAGHLYYQDDGAPGTVANVQATVFADVASPSSPVITGYDADYPAGQARSFYRIVLGSPLPAITGGVVIDTTTQPLTSPGAGPVVDLDATLGGDGLALQAGSSGSTIRGFVVNRAPGAGIRILGSSNNVVAGNYLGTDVAGIAAGPGNGTGVSLGGSAVATNGNRVGGTTAADRNLVSGNGGDGIFIDGGLGGASGTLVQGNRIGTNSAGTAGVANAGAGVRLDNAAAGNTVGGTAAGTGNLLAFNGLAGVVLAPAAGGGNSILGNAILSNTGLGIDLSGDGVTPNDAFDPDVGPNALLNFPLITALYVNAGILTVHFQIDAPAGSYRVELFRNPGGSDPSGFGEGEAFAASTNVAHPGLGPVTYTHTFPGAFGDRVTATSTACTDGAVCAAFGDTSEFARVINAVTAVTLLSFEAAGRDAAVDLAWETASELQNLGFHLYRAEAASGPYSRITPSLIPGLGSSVLGRSYAYRDAGLVNGTTYFYQLEDVDTSGVATRHGPVEAIPHASSGEPGAAADETTHGDPLAVVLREIDRSASHVTLELRTGGFFSAPAPGGRVRLRIPGFESASEPGQPSLPMRRAFVPVAAGRNVVLSSVAVSDVVAFPGLRPSAEGHRGIEASADGTIRSVVRPAREGAAYREIFPRESVRVVGTGFQGEVKKAELLLSPLRWDAGGVALARRLVVRLDFVGSAAGETSQGGVRGRRAVPHASHARRQVRARFVVGASGLYRVAFEEVFPSAGSPGESVARLRLSRQGESVAFHVEPDPTVFGPGSSLYFVSEGSAQNPHGDAVYELEQGVAGLAMDVQAIGPRSRRAVPDYDETLDREENFIYQAALLDAPDLWLWDAVVSPQTRSYSFTIDRLSPSRPARLSVAVQGGSDFPGVLDHHVRLAVNGTVVGEDTWDGKTSRTVEAEVPASLLREGPNTLALENVGDAGASESMVILNRFRVTYPRRLSATGGTLRGRFARAGQAVVDGLGGPGVAVIDTTSTPRWLRGAFPTPGGGWSFPVDEGRSYLATSIVRRPEVRLATPSTLKERSNQADYILVAPRVFLEAAEPLLDRRRSEGLSSLAVPVEEIQDEFGHGEAGPAAIKRFLEYAYQSWAPPSVRYVLLLGDASYDPKSYLGTGVRDWLSGQPVKTGYLWTVSDPAYASVNGEDLLPDVAIGRLPASSVEEAAGLVAKVLAYEDGGGDFGGRAVLVADNPDAAGDFEAEADEVAATFLETRPVEKIYYSTEGAGTRARILGAFDAGASFLSYVGHGGAVTWASENFFNRWDVPSLLAQSRQPFLLTMNCLNGLFHHPALNSLSEELLKADGRGAIAAFSPSGMSLDEPAHRYHQAVVEEILSGGHARLGDAILAAQEEYAASGHLPELLSIYHLLGDPALRIR
jgi:hypothetical protein